MAETENAQTMTERNQRKVRIGTVVSDRMDKTIIVAVERRRAHPVYGKQMLRTTRFHVHDEEGTARPGDTVRIAETRPISKTKCWRLLEIMNRAE